MTEPIDIPLSPSAETAGPDHRAEPLTTQAANPGRASLRTMVAVGIPAFITLLGIVPEIIQEIVDGFGQQLPEGMRLWLLAAAAFITALSGIITRVMAMPKLIALTQQVRSLNWLAPSKTPKS